MSATLLGNFAARFLTFGGSTMGRRKKSYRKIEVAAEFLERRQLLSAINPIPTESPASVSSKVPASIGVFRNGYFYLDANGNQKWDGTSGGDSTFTFTGTIPISNANHLITGDWNGDGITDFGAYSNSGETVEVYLDSNGNHVFDAGDAGGHFGTKGDQLELGDWNGDGKIDLGVFRNGIWFLDYNGNGKWDGSLLPGDDRIAAFGITGDTPITGDWNGDGKTEIGVFRKGKWYLDLNGNGKWDGQVAGGDLVFNTGVSTDIPLTGDWNGDGVTDIGVVRNGTFYIDANGNRKWDGATNGDKVFKFGNAGDIPIVGVWKLSPNANSESQPRPSTARNESGVNSLLVDAVFSEPDLSNMIAPTERKKWIGN